jgi:hypothetical protein
VAAGAQPPDAGDVLDALDEEARPDLSEALTSEPTRMGPAWLWQVDTPPPAEAIGGTVVVSAFTGRVLFAATTSWQGGHVLVG